jgi:uncharacterized membrane protein
MATRDDPDPTNPEPAAAARAFRVPAILLGIGLGGFFDGIVVHQILQWHHMVSELYPPTNLANIQLNTTLDGLFHLAAWVVTLAGAALTWRAMGTTRARPSGRLLVGGLLGGWGGFNLVEGLVDHQILKIHHVRPGPDEAAWDIGFLIVSAVMTAAGAYLLRARRDAAATPSRDE